MGKLASVQHLANEARNRAVPGKHNRFGARLSNNRLRPGAEYGYDGEQEKNRSTGESHLGPIPRQSILFIKPSLVCFIAKARLRVADEVKTVNSLGFSFSR
jgi:hypothetical protein